MADLRCFSLFHPILSCSTLEEQGLKFIPHGARIIQAHFPSAEQLSSNNDRPEVQIHHASESWLVSFCLI